MIEVSFMLLWDFLTFCRKGEGGHKHPLEMLPLGSLALISLVGSAFGDGAGHSKSPSSEVNLNSPSLLCSPDH